MTASEDENAFALIFEDLCILYSDGATQTFALPNINSQPTCAVLLPNKIVIGYESGEILIYELDGTVPSIFHFHAAPLMDIVVTGKSLWCLHKDSVVVRIYDVDVLLTSASLSYGCIQKYQLPGDVKSIGILDGGSEIVAVGSTPMIQQVYDLSKWDGDIIADELDAMKIRTRHAASKMANSLTGWWSRNSSTDSLGAFSKPKSTLINKRVIKVTPDVTMDESDRTINVAEASPDGKYAMVADAFNGRIFLYHAAAGLFTRLWKGYRGAQFRFLSDHVAAVLAPRQMFLELRDIKEDRRLALLNLSEEEEEDHKKDFGLLSKSVLVSSTPTGLEFHRLVFN